VSFSPETMLALMSLADGELEGEARQRIEKLVAESEDARRIVEAMRSPRVGAWLGESMRQRAVDAGADGIADAVMATLDASRPDAPSVVRIADARTGKPRLPVMAAAACAALALAAGVAFYVASGAKGGAQRAPVASVGPPGVDTQVPSPPANGVEVDEIDSPSRVISVFEIPMGTAAAAAAGEVPPSSIVIWIEDDPGAK
jgi:hypothetical protein